MNFRRRLLMLLLATLPLLSACMGDTSVPKPPFSLPFEVQKSGTIIETEVRVVEHRGYIFGLLLMYSDPAGRERVRKLASDGDETDANGNLIDPVVPIRLRFKINAIESTGERPIFDKEISELRKQSHSAGSPGYYSKRIDIVPLKPGQYRITVESLKDVPELVGTPVLFQIGRDAKSGPIGMNPLLGFVWSMFLDYLP